MTFSRSSARLLVPNALSRSPTGLSRVLVIGSCLAEGIVETLQRTLPPCECDFVLFNNIMELPAAPPRPIDAYDFQLLQMPIRSVLPESTVMRARFSDPDSYRLAFDLASEKLRQMLDAGLRYATDSLPTFVTNFLVPQHAALGRLLPAADLRNPSHFVSALDHVLAQRVDSLSGAHLVDIDALSSAVGRLHVQDDLVWSVTHGGALTDWDHARDLERIVAPDPLSTQIEFRTGDFLEAMAYEIEAMYRTYRGLDMVKLVIVDLDDTLWRGVIAEQETITPDVREGWPLGMVEALTVLQRRGILLAIVSKNELDTIRGIWDDIFLGMLRLEDFAAVRVNWEPKIENVRRVIRDVNVLPSSVVFIDDNPVERDAVERAFPEVRVLGANIYEVRHILLWSAETQVAQLTDESVRRNEMVRAQVKREEIRAALSRDEFLAQLHVRVDASTILDRNDARLGRVLELVNKTNQFNSTGERWTPAELASFIGDGGRVHTFRVSDALTEYGLTAVAFTRGPVVNQFVMSCRVMGLEVERAILRHLLDGADGPLIIRLIETNRNRPIREVLSQLGAVAENGSCMLAPGPWETVSSLPQVAAGLDALQSATD